jgi:hypothetical protein
LDLSATLEPDADHDGFGDETQDQCPTTPAPRVLARSSPATPTKKKCKKHKKHRSAESAKKKKCKKRKHG